MFPEKKSLLKQMHLPTPAPPLPSRRLSTVPLTPCREEFLRTPELLYTAFSFLARHDLVLVVRVCRLFCDEGKRWLYRAVELSSDLPNVSETIALLGTDSVGAYIRKVALTTVSPRTSAQPAWFLPNIVQYWKKLQRLELFGVPFWKSEDMKVFRTTLQTCCRNLHVLSYRHDMSVGFPVGEFGFLPLDSGSVDKSASSHSLTNITLAGSVVHYIGSSFDTLIGLRFPNLKSLELGLLVRKSRSVSFEETTASLMGFVSAHTSLEHLSLGKRAPPDDRESLFHLDGPLIVHDFLPHLRSFEGGPKTIATLIKGSVLSTFSLTSLSLVVCTESDLSTMVDAIKLSPTQSMSAVQNLKVVFPSIACVHQVLMNNVAKLRSRCLDEIADVCPNITNWSGNLPMMKAIELKDTFRLYLNLETLSVPWYTLINMDSTLPSGEINYFAPLAGPIRSLKTIVACKPPYSNHTDKLYTLVRGPSGKLSQVVCEEIRLEKSSL